MRCYIHPRNVGCGERTEKKEEDMVVCGVCTEREVRSYAGGMYVNGLNLKRLDPRVQSRNKQVYHSCASSRGTSILRLFTPFRDWGEESGG